MGRRKKTNTEEVLESLEDVLDSSDTLDDVGVTDTQQVTERITLRSGTVIDGEFYPKGSVIDVTDKVKAQLKPFRYFG